MKNRGRHSPRSPNGELIVLVAIAVLIGTIALLRLAIERERAAGPAQVELSAWPVSADTVSTNLAPRASSGSGWRKE
ncbi:hypothetical protein [Variovorax sp. Root473]|jgi:hypothetical protein|uniref:hypothetical protein n=1 Tax=Variovorax sp. Root473 TaxID=1736541 RepID=UPI0012F9B0D4|nr:hypothetical protein [Variovorax sp. Root473]